MHLGRCSKQRAPTRTAVLARQKTRDVQNKKHHSHVPFAPLRSASTSRFFFWCATLKLAVWRCHTRRVHVAFDVTNKQQTEVKSAQGGPCYLVALCPVRKRKPELDSASPACISRSNPGWSLSGLLRDTTGHYTGR
jgi:hypothetical protein